MKGEESQGWTMISTQNTTMLLLP